MTLPEGFPRIKNGADYYAFNDEPNPETPLRFFITWDILSEAEIEQIVMIARQWLGGDSPITITSDKFLPKVWYVENSEYRIGVGNGPDGDPRTYFNIFPKAKNYKFPELNLSLADNAVENTANRPLDWENTPLNDIIPKLTDKITRIAISDSSYEIKWKYMDLAEAESVVKKIKNSFVGEYTYGMSFGGNIYTWDLEGEINGRHMTVNVSLKYKRNEQMIVTLTM